MDAETIGRGLIYFGAALVAVGGLVWGLGHVLDLGDLPGDWSYQGENVRVYVPIGTMIVLSLLLTLLLNLLLRLFR
jgi:hypothetical protein